MLGDDSMTRLLITIDRGPYAKREECGLCEFISSEEPHSWCELFHGTDEVYQCAEDADNPMRCPECLAAEVSDGV